MMARYKRQWLVYACQQCQQPLLTLFCASLVAMAMLVLGDDDAWPNLSTGQYGV